MTTKYHLIAFILFALLGCETKKYLPQIAELTTNAIGQPVYQDKPYMQDYVVKYYLIDNQENINLKDVSANRNGNIQILSNQGLLVPENGSLFYSGGLIPDVSYSPLIPKKITDLETYKNHTVYLDDKHVFSNAWAGKIQITHGLPNAKYFAAGKDFHFLVSDGEKLTYLNKTGEKIWTGLLSNVKQIIYQESKGRFLLVTTQTVSELIPGQPIKELYKGNISCAAIGKNGTEVVIGTSNGYVFLSENKLISNVPWPEITCIKEINGALWFGSTWGAYKLNEDGKYSYYSGERWLPDNHVVELEKGPENTVLVLTKKGLGQIHFKKMTLEAKAMFYEKQVREKNIRYGFNCSVSALSQSYASAKMGAQASDNLWTSMYLSSQLFRYKATGSEEAKLNAYEAFEAMERLHDITPIDGLFARSFERDYKVINTKKEGWEKKELLSGSPALIWMPGSDHPNWTWRSTASSDQTVGQMFALISMLELVDDKDWRNRALKCLDDLMGYIVDNDYYIIDVDGEPTLWGKWNPDYVNSFPVNVGDRRLNSSNIISFLQAAYKFTGKEKYKTSAYQLMEEHGYLENLTRPISTISPSDADEWSKTLSHEWNHSDDEMYFLAYWGLHPFAFTPELQAQYKESIKDHWQAERPEKNALWNLIYGMTTGATEFDLDESVWFLKNYPMDLRTWKMQNSHRKDIELISDNFRGQTTKELLPLGETPLYRHNGNIYDLDRNGDGQALISAGDTWLLPYWMGRYMGVISAPVE
ncbi:hypothetical protein [Reichenbachiella sp. MALMAid0571]|uniref:hypothetical protein n=1 Tax=Reichenbachiella sp. MALMAid0571 TaxID=3143939 RepID=UPI0032E002DA